MSLRRTLLSAVVLAAVALAAAGCGASPPEAAFTASPVSGTAPVTVTFTDTSTNGPTSWQWDFGDGERSTEQSPTHEYGLAGSYTVTLRVGNDEGFDDVVRQSLITVEAPPNPVCARVQELRAILGRVATLEIGPGVVDELRQILRDARAAAGALVADAGEEYGDEAEALRTAVESLGTAVSALETAPAESIDEVVAAVSSVTDALRALDEALGKGCGA